MFKIIEKKEINDNIFKMTILAPFIAKKALAGQFIIFRVDEVGERVPLTIADYDRENGTITIIFQAIGSSTKKLSLLNEGEFIADVVGPLGVATHLDGYKKACVIGGGVGCAIAYPSAKALFNKGTSVDIIAGFRNRDIVMLENEMKDVSDNLFITTDDGSYGEKGLVTTKLESLINEGNDYDLVIAIGPVVMMKFVCLLTKKYNIKTIVSLNPIMIDGTGMCGGCRVSVGGETKFACVDGPDFDGHLVDFDELMNRNTLYAQEEKDHVCRLFGAKNQ